MNLRDFILLALCPAMLLCMPAAGQSTSLPHPMAVLPSSRSLQVSEMGSVFVTAINPTNQAFTNCHATLNNMTADGGNFSYQRTDPQTNQPIGNVGDRFEIPPGGLQTWIQFFQPAATHAPQEVQVDMVCDGFTGARAPTVGVDTLAFSVSNSSPLDLVALGATASNDGILRIASAQGAGAFAVSGVNLGISGAVTVTPGTGQTSLPLTLTVCETNAQGQCLSAPTRSASIHISISRTARTRICRSPRPRSIT